MTASLEILEVKPGIRFSKQVLRDMLPDIETALFFGKVYELDAHQLGNLLACVCDSDVAQALLAEGGLHSTTLQDYVVDIIDYVPNVQKGDVSFGIKPPQGEILPALWESLEVEVAASIQAVADKLKDVVSAMPGKQGSMVFKSMAVMNTRRPTIGDYRASIRHAPAKDNLVVFDVSGSMTESTVRRIVEDVTAMAYMANAHMAIVSNTCTYWEPGSYSVDDILRAAEFGGTYYEELKPLFDRDWGVVVTIADYDSSYSAKEILGQCTGTIDELLDVSLVNQPTFLAECVGQRAAKVRPLIVAATSRVLNR